MLRTLAVVAGIVFVALVAHGCMSVVPLSEGFYPAQLDTGEVQVIDARTMERTSIERILDAHYVIGRFDVSIPDGQNFEQVLTDEVKKGEARALNAGGRVLMYTDDSDMIAVIKRDARYAGAQGAITMYVMLARSTSE